MKTGLRSQRAADERRASVLECGGKRSATPLSSGAHFDAGGRAGAPPPAAHPFRPPTARNGVRALPLFCLILLHFAFCLCAKAQSFSIDWFTVDGGGSTSTGGVYAVSGTLGQPDAGKMSGGNFTLEGGFWGLIAAIQTEGAPKLLIELTNNQVKVSWAAPAPGWVLTETNQLVAGGSPVWPVVSAAQYATNDGRIFILTPPQPLLNRYYRLHKP